MKRLKSLWLCVPAPITSVPTELPRIPPRCGDWDVPEEKIEGVQRAIVERSVFH